MQAGSGLGQRIVTPCRQLCQQSKAPRSVQPEHLPVNWIGESTDGEKLAEFAGRLCYMSQKNPASRTTHEYLENIKKQGHGSVFEHANYSLLLEGVSRSLTHELVRHRAGFAYSQLSQRYVDESTAAFVMPPAIQGDETLEQAWTEQMTSAQASYVAAVDRLMERYAWVEDRVHRRKMARDAARSVLPNGTETKIVVSGNEVLAQHMRFRMAVWHPELTMVTFGKLMSSPGAIEEVLREVAGGKKAASRF